MIEDVLVFFEPMPVDPSSADSEKGCHKEAEDHSLDEGEGRRGW